MMNNKLETLNLNAIEDFTGYYANITSDHAYVHAGLAFSAVVECGSISSAYNVAFTTPTVASGKYIHWRPIGISSSADYVNIKMYEGETATGGTANAPFNRNRNSSTATTMQSFVRGASVTPAGTLIYETGVGSTGGPQSRAGGGGGADEEILLKPNTTYAIVFTPAGATTVIATFFWYEEGRGV